MKNQTVSIVVPIYNMEKYLSRCMDTLLAQTKENIEIILVNDGSTDGSVGLCEEYASKYPQLIRVVHKENGGLSSARNAGINAAVGKYIVFPDPDDWVESDYIEQFMNVQMEYSPDLVCLGYYIEYDGYGFSTNKDGAFVELTGEEARRSLLLPPMMNGFAWNKLYNLDIIRENQLFFLDDVGTTEDLDFAFRYLKYCRKVCFNPSIRVYHYYQRAGAATHSGFSKKKLQSIRTYEKIMEAYIARNEIVEAAENEICNTAINLCWMYKNGNCNDTESWEMLRRYIRKYLKGYLKSKNHNKGRKLQAVLAYYVPDLYVMLKNRVQRQ